MSTPQDQLERELSDDELVDHVGREFQIPRGLRHSLFKQESGGRQSVRGRTVTSPTGARGFGQLMPATAKMLGVNPDDKVENIVGSMAYLRKLYDRGRQSATDDAEGWARAVAGYFSGPGNQGREPGQVFRRDRSDGRVRVSQYVEQILGRWADFDGPDNDWDEAPAPANVNQKSKQAPQATATPLPRQAGASSPPLPEPVDVPLLVPPRLRTPTALEAQDELSRAHSIERPELLPEPSLPEPPKVVRIPTPQGKSVEDFFRATMKSVAESEGLHGDAADEFVEQTVKERRAAGEPFYKHADGSPMTTAEVEGKIKLGAQSAAVSPQTRESARKFKQRHVAVTSREVPDEEPAYQTKEGAPVAAQAGTNLNTETPFVRLKVAQDSTPESLLFEAHRQYGLLNNLSPQSAEAYARVATDEIKRRASERTGGRLFAGEDSVMSAAKKAGETAFQIGAPASELLKEFRREEEARRSTESKLEVETGLALSDETRAEREQVRAEVANRLRQATEVGSKAAQEYASAMSALPEMREREIDRLTDEEMARRIEAGEQRARSEALLTPEDRAEITRRAEAGADTSWVTRAAINPFFSSVAAGGEDVLAGLARVAEGLSNASGVTDSNPVSEYFQKRAHIVRRAQEEADKISPTSKPQQAVAFGAEILGNVALMSAAQRLGGSKAAFGGTAFFGSLGRGESVGASTLEGVKGLAYERVFKATAGLPLGQRAATVYAASVGIERATGASDDEAMKVGVTNALFAVLPGLREAGVRWLKSKGKESYALVRTTPEGRVRVEGVRDSPPAGTIETIEVEPGVYEAVVQSPKLLRGRAEPSAPKTEPGAPPAAPVSPEVVSHPNPAIDGRQIVARTGDGRVVVPNESNKSGVSVVKPRGEVQRAEDVRSHTRSVSQGERTLREGVQDKSGEDIQLETPGQASEAGAQEEALIPPRFRESPTPLTEFAEQVRTMEGEPTSQVHVEGLTKGDVREASRRALEGVGETLKPLRAPKPQQPNVRWNSMGVQERRAYLSDFYPASDPQALGRLARRTYSELPRSARLQVRSQMEAEGPARPPTRYQQTGVRRRRVDPSVMSLSEFVRAMGGVRPDRDMANRGELEGLTGAESGTSGLATKGGLSAEDMAQAAAEAGYPVGTGGSYTKGRSLMNEAGEYYYDSGAFLEALSRDLAGDKVYSSERQYDYDQEYERGKTDDDRKAEVAFERMMADESLSPAFAKLVYNGAEDLNEDELQALRQAADAHGVRATFESSFGLEGLGAQDVPQGQGRAPQSYPARQDGTVEDPIPFSGKRGADDRQQGFAVEELLAPPSVTRTRELQGYDASQAEYSRLETRIGSDLATKVRGFQEEGQPQAVRSVGKLVESRAPVVESLGDEGRQRASDLLLATSKLRELKRTRTPVSDYLSQGNLFGDRELTPRQEAMLAGLEKNYRKTVDEYLPEQKEEEAQGALFSATKTPEFKRWFAGSKVVDGKGGPRVVYHVTDRDFDVFAPQGRGSDVSATIGSWFAEEPRLLEERSAQLRQGRRMFKEEGRDTTYPVFLNIKSPLRLKSREGLDAWILKNADRLPQTHVEEINEVLDFPEFDDKPDDLKNLEQYGTSEAVRDAVHRFVMRWQGVFYDEARILTEQAKANAKKAGYDGVEIDNDQGFGRAFVAFEPEQIKSATGNRGTFSPDDPNILHSLTGEQAEQADAFELLRDLDYSQDAAGRVRINPSTAEFLARLSEQMALEQAGGDLSRVSAAQRFTGMTLYPVRVGNTVKMLKRVAEAVPQYRDRLRGLAATLRKSQRRGGVALVYSEEASVPHEEFHRLSYLASGRAPMIDRVDVQDAMRQAGYGKARDALVSEFGYPDSDALIIEETAAHLFEGRHEEMGMTEDESARFMAWWFSSFEARNGRIAPELLGRAFSAREEFLPDVSARLGEGGPERGALLRGVAEGRRGGHSQGAGGVEARGVRAEASPASGPAGNLSARRREEVAPQLTSPLQAEAARIASRYGAPPDLYKRITPLLRRFYNLSREDAARLEEIKNRIEPEQPFIDLTGESVDAVMSARKGERGAVNLSAMAETRPFKFLGEQFKDPKTGRVTFKSLFVNGRETPVRKIIPALRRAGLLASIKMHVRNVGGNTAFAVTEEGARPIAALADIYASRKTGLRTHIAPSPLSVAKAVIGKEGSLIRGTADFWRTLWEGDPEAQAKYEREEFRSGLPVLDAYVNFVTNSVQASDRFAKAYHLSRALDDLAKVEAKNEKAKDASVDLRGRAKELRRAPTDWMQREAIVRAEIGTFQDANAVTRAVAGAKEALERGGTLGRALKFALELKYPFTLTPSNIFQRILEYTPAGFAVAAHRYKQIGKNVKGRAEEAGRAAHELEFGLRTPEQVKELAGRLADEMFTKEEQARFAETFGRAGFGTALGALAVLLMTKGLLDLVGVTDYESEKDKFFAKRTAGVRDGSLKIPLTGYRVTITGNPLGNALIALATAYEQAARPSVSAADRAITAGRGATEIAKQNPFLREELRTESDDRPYAAKFKENVSAFGASFLPRVGGEVGDVLDPTQRTSFRAGPLAQFAAKSPLVPLRAPMKTTKTPLPDRGDMLRRALRLIDPFDLSRQQGATPRSGPLDPDSESPVALPNPREEMRRELEKMRPPSKRKRGN